MPSVTRAPIPTSRTPSPDRRSGRRAAPGTDLRSAFCRTRFGQPVLARGQGCIAHRGFPLASAYALREHGMAGLTLSLAAEGAARGVPVNGISPGFFMTELNQAKMHPERKESALRRTPMGRFGRMEEPVGAAVHLASPSAGFVTGTIINLDGGYLANGI